jgi:hypothetical protein
VIDLDRNEMACIRAGSVTLTVCGIALGATIAATALYGVTGFLLTVNKTLTACTIALVTSPVER